MARTTIIEVEGKICIITEGVTTTCNRGTNGCSIQHRHSGLIKDIQHSKEAQFKGSKPVGPGNAITKEMLQRDRKLESTGEKD